MSAPRSVAFHTLGCKLNFSETSSISRLFEKEGYTINQFEQGADIYVINTCSVTDFADRKCRKVVRQVYRQSPEALVVVTGCYAQLKPGEIAEIPGVDLVLGASEKFRLLDYINNFTGSGQKAFIHSKPIEELNQFSSAYSVDDRTRSFLKIQDGCDYKCTFCTIPLARGASRSDTIENILFNAQQLAQKGVKEIVLTGVNIGDFGNGTQVIEGLRPKKEATFIDLIRELDKVQGIQRFRISSIEPNLLTNEIIEFTAQSKLFVPHFHIPLQSGNDKQLTMMKRRYKRELYQQRVEKIRELIPHCNIGVDVIVGFPGETNEDFLETYRFLNEMDISYLHVFTYSERPDTPARNLPGRVQPAIRKKRSEMLRILSHKKRTAYAMRFKDQVRPVLFEARKKGDFMTGFTDNYIKVKIPFDLLLANTVHSFHISGFDEHATAYGKIITSI